MQITPIYYTRYLWALLILGLFFISPDFYALATATETNDLITNRPYEQICPTLKWEEQVCINMPLSTEEQGIINGKVIRINKHGNILTNVPASQLSDLEVAFGESLFVTIGTQAFSVPFVRSYGSVPPGDPLASIQSFNRVELAANMDHLANQINAKAHMPLTIRKEQDTLFDYRRSGGTQPHPTRLVIHRDGRAFTWSNGKRHDFEVPAERLEALETAAKEVPWRNAARSQADKEAPTLMGADDYRVDLHYNGQNIRATSLDLPDSLATLLDRLNPLLARQE